MLRAFIFACQQSLNAASVKYQIKIDVFCPNLTGKEGAIHQKISRYHF